MGTELTRCGANDVNSHRLWSAIANVNQPEIVVEAHSNFIKAGADIIITNSFFANISLYQGNGFVALFSFQINSKTFESSDPTIRSVPIETYGNNYI